LPASTICVDLALGGHHLANALGIEHHQRAGIVLQVKIAIGDVQSIATRAEGQANWEVDLIERWLPTVAWGKTTPEQQPH
jgi:hypothetical protein